MRVEGVIVSFINDPARGPRHGIAKVLGRDAFSTEVFLPAACLRKELNGHCVHYQPGEERPTPMPNMRVVMDISPDGAKKFIANNWAIESRP